MQAFWMDILDKPQLCSTNEILENVHFAQTKHHPIRFYSTVKYTAFQCESYQLAH